MSFYSDYYNFLKQVQLKVKGINQAITPVDTLIQETQFPNREVTLNEIEGILQDLKRLNALLNDQSLDLELLSLLNQLTLTLAKELKHHLGAKVPSSLQMEHWLKANFTAAQELIIGIGQGEWLVKELKNYSYRYRDIPNVPSCEQNLLFIILNRVVALDIIPSKQWYFSIPELKKYEPQDALFKLAYRDIKEFQKLHSQYPGFLSRATRSFEELSVFCQLLPSTFTRLLHSQPVKWLIPDIVHYVRILEKLIDVPQRSRFELTEAAITCLNDLVAVTNAFPTYFHLIAKAPNGSADPKVYLEGSCARFIQTRADLMRLDLSYPTFQALIQRTPRLRALVGTSEDYLTAVINVAKFKRRMDLSERRLKPLGLFQEAAVDSRFLTLGKAINMMQFQEDAGYYTNGNISFSADNKQGHFSTEASEGYVLAIALSYRAFQIWQKVPEEHKACFEILECGAGEGDLCFKMMDFIKAMVLENKEWLAFEKAIHYTIIEISPTLLQRQSKKLQNLIHEGKVELLQGDALNVTQYKKIAALHISNELVDMFPSEQIVIDEFERCQVVMTVPILLEEAYEYLQNHHPKSVQDLQEEVVSFRALLNKKNIQLEHQGLPITAQRFRDLLPITAKKGFGGPLDCFLFSSATMPVGCFPMIEQYLLNHKEIFTGMQPGDSKIICPQLDSYSRFVAQHSLVSLIIDYGETTFKLRNVEYRCYGPDAAFYKNIPLRRPGKNDVTYDIDFSALMTGIKQSAPEGIVSLVRLGVLLPDTIVIPKSYAPLYPMQDQKDFLKSLFFAVAYFSPAANFTLEGLDKGAQVVTQEDFFNLAIHRAEHILQLNTAEETKSSLVI